jgi:RNA polymerase sigma factor (sigma-70 family)
MRQSGPAPFATDLSVDDLAFRCQKESATPSERRDPRYCLELFRRAIIDRDNRAWAAIHAQYYVLVRHWLSDVRNADDLIQETFARFSQAMTPGRSASGEFPSLYAVLAYLRVIAVNQSINEKRQLERERRVLGRRVEPRRDDPDAEDPELADSHAPDALDNVIRQELADLIRSLVPDDTEWLVISLSYEYGLFPREIAQLHPQRFRNAAEVSKIKERVRKRLQSNARLRQYLQFESENATVWRSLWRRLR